jgi:hypothetical protein
MRIKRAILIPAILALSAAGSALAGATIAVAPSTSVVAMAPNMYYNG